MSPHCADFFEPLRRPAGSGAGWRGAGRHSVGAVARLAGSRWEAVGARASMSLPPRGPRNPVLGAWLLLSGAGVASGCALSQGAPPVAEKPTAADSRAAAASVLRKPNVPPPVEKSDPAPSSVVAEARKNPCEPAA